MKVCLDEFPGSSINLKLQGCFLGQCKTGNVIVQMYFPKCSVCWKLNSKIKVSRNGTLKNLPE